MSGRPSSTSNFHIPSLDLSLINKKELDTSSHIPSNSASGYKSILTLLSNATFSIHPENLLSLSKKVFSLIASHKNYFLNATGSQPQEHVLEEYEGTATPLSDRSDLSNLSEMPTSRNSSFCLLHAFREPIIQERYKSSPSERSPERKRLAEIHHKLLKTSSIQEHIANYQTLSEEDKESVLLGLEYTMGQVAELHSLILNSYSRSKFSIKFPDWHFYSDSRFLSNSYGFYGQVWINREKKQIAIVSAGTKLQEFASFDDSKLSNLYGVFHFVKDIINDIQVAFKRVPSQYKAGIEKLINVAIPQLKSDLTLDLSEYDLIFCGHSLGGVLSDMGAIYSLKYKESFHSVHSLTMENPGSKEMVKTLVSNMQKHGYISSDFDENAFKSLFTVLNNKPNWINTAGEQFGHVFRNITDFDDVELPFGRFIPSIIKHTLEHLRWHGKDALDDIPTLIYESEWPVGLGYSYAKEKALATWSFCLETFIKNTQYVAPIIALWDGIASIIESVETYAEESTIIGVKFLSGETLIDLDSRGFYSFDESDSFESSM